MAATSVLSGVHESNYMSDLLWPYKCHRQCKTWGPNLCQWLYR